MSEPVQFEVKKLFLDALNAKPYRVVLYGMYTGWRDETRTMIVDEAHGLCKIEYDKVSVLNSHGTDIDYELYCSEDYTLERMADILENEYSPAAISKANPGQREYYKPEAYAYAAKLRESGAKFSTVQTVGKAFLSEHLPECEITRLNYASCSTIVFEAVRQSGEKVVIKMSQIHKAHKAIVDADLDRLISLEGDNNLLPIYGKKWFSLEANYETLLIWHPLMETIRSDGKNFSMTQDKAKYTWTFDWRIRLAVALAKALKTLHENGLVHHDVKPENLFYVNNESEIDWYLGDFDSIKPVEQQYEGKTTGTLAYAAPEILERKPFSFSSDIYAWGRTMFFLLHGSVPNGNVKASVEIDGKKIHLHTKGSSKTWNEKEPRVLQFYKIIAKAMDEDPVNRYANGRELLEALEKAEKAVAEVPQQETKPKTDMPNKLEEKMKDRKIQWRSGCFDEIELVYDKAREKEATAQILAALETGALEEAKAYSDKIIVDGSPIAPERFDTLPDPMKEHVMYNLSAMGLASFSSPITDSKITVRLSPHIQHVRCCTAFSILNRLEKLDGAFNMLHPQATLEIQAPLGGKQGLVEIEMLIALLYPWLKVTEVSSNEVAAGVSQKPQTAKPQCSSAESKTVTPVPEVVAEKDTKRGFWARLFGKKK